MADIPDDMAAFLAAERRRWQPWTALAAAFTAGAGLMAGLVGLITLILHLAGRL